MSFIAILFDVHCYNFVSGVPTLRVLYIGTTSKFSLDQRHNLISTTFQHCSNVRCPLGSWYYPVLLNLKNNKLNVTTFESKWIFLIL